MNDCQLKILSLGAGVQSTTVLLMSCKGELPKLDCAVFADTQWEPQAVYEHLAWLEREAKRHGIPIYRVTASNIKADALVSQVRGRKVDGHRWASMPFRTVSPEGNEGMIRRQCTSEYKIQPIEQFIRYERLGLKPRQRIPSGTSIEHWYGISLDEKERTRMSTRRWEDFYYPLILTRPMLRGECLNWLRRHYPHRAVPRSACIGCPYRSNAEWRWLRDNSPDEWQEAIQFDKAMRNAGGMRGKLYIHRDCVPLEEADIDSLEDKGQINWINECMGMCGV